MVDEDILDVMKRCECKASEVLRCFRCEMYGHHDEGQVKNGAWYCANCYDDMFVPWPSKPKEEA